MFTHGDVLGAQGLLFVILYQVSSFCPFFKTLPQNFALNFKITPDGIFKRSLIRC